MSSWWITPLTRHERIYTLLLYAIGLATGMLIGWRWL